MRRGTRDGLATRDRDLGAELFYTYSSDLIFPPNVGVPGRCWKLRQTQMHSDVTVRHFPLFPSMHLPP